MTTDTTPVTEPDPSIDAIVDADGHMPHVPAEVREAIAQGHSALMAALTIIERRTHERDQYAAMVAKVTDPAYLEGALRAAGATATEAARLRERVAALEAGLRALLQAPAIADENHSDPSWGCQETAEAVAAARTLVEGGST